MRNIANIANPIWGSTGELYQKQHCSSRTVGEAALLSCFSHVKQRNTLREDKEIGQVLKEQNPPKL